MLQGFGFGMKSARVADQIDAEAKAGQMALQNVRMVSQQFDFVETQLQQFAQMISQSGDQMAAMQFQTMQQQINNIQSQIVNGLQTAEQSFRTIDGLTDKIQN